MGLSSCRKGKMRSLRLWVLVSSPKYTKKKPNQKGNVCGYVRYTCLQCVHAGTGGCLLTTGDVLLSWLLCFAFTYVRSFTEVSDASLGDGQSPLLGMGRAVHWGLPAPCLHPPEAEGVPVPQGLNLSAMPLAEGACVASVVVQNLFHHLPSHFITGHSGNRNLSCKFL